mgnify:FL=1
MQEHRQKSQTQMLIIHALTQDPELTRTQIARTIGRKKTPHLTALLDQMVQDGILEHRIVQFHNGVSGYVYSLTQAYKGELFS